MDDAPAWWCCSWRVSSISCAPGARGATSPRAPDHGARSIPSSAGGAGGLEDWPERFVIITAYATTGETWPESRNEARNEELEAVLQDHGQWMRAITGHSPETKHMEPGWAVELDWEEGCDLGDRFQQDAIYVVDGDVLSVTYCDERRALVPVGAFRDRLTPF